MALDQNNRYKIVVVLVLASFTFLIARVAKVQLMDKQSQIQANTTSLVETIQKPSRGLIYDRNGELVVFNKFVYDVNITYNDLDPAMDTSLLFDLLNINQDFYTKHIEKDWSDVRYSRFVPFTFMSRIPDTMALQFKEYLHAFPGFALTKEAVRGYKYPTASHVLGYISEVDRQIVNDSESEYVAGDYIGKSGVELYYEDILKGSKGHRYELKDNLGRRVGDYLNGSLNKEALSGSDLTLGLDIELQRYAEKLMENKKGGIVAIEPSSGEILVMLSNPTFNLEDLSIGQNRGEKFAELYADTLKPFYDRSIMAHYPPGSIFKPVLGLIALQEGIITPHDHIHCGGGYFYKTNVWRCHAGGGNNDMESALTRSCNTYFFTVYRDLINKYGFSNPEKGLFDIHQKLGEFGLGNKLGVDLPLEGTGLNPTPAYYDDLYRNKGDWRFTYILSNAIGQGEVELTTLQMAHAVSIIANRGTYKMPHIIKNINGETQDLPPKFLDSRKVSIDSSHFKTIITGMEKAVSSGTARAAYVPGLDVCGKTGTSENRGKDHSVFYAFAPEKNPKIAIAVFIENGGWGGSYAAPIASLVIEKYVNDSIQPSRKWLEERMLKSDLINNTMLP
ncbi:penicillin-binding protein 2 [Membranihabitans maritimus]|uniref:penicillin-binding protein 2 n=1 Tax=Membranihabitans maritimus TaxID=2904244 RepID=UPI001F000AB5|nr:penicillin-binding protein 2 [Membranihabitans maritimus]